MLSVSVDNEMQRDIQAVFGGSVRMLYGGFNEQCVHCSSRSFLTWRQLHHSIRTVLLSSLYWFLLILCVTRTHTQTVANVRSFTH